MTSFPNTPQLMHKHNNQFLTKQIENQQLQHDASVVTLPDTNDQSDHAIIEIAFRRDFVKSEIETFTCQISPLDRRGNSPDEKNICELTLFEMKRPALSLKLRIFFSSRGGESVVLIQFRFSSGFERLIQLCLGGSRDRGARASVVIVSSLGSV